MGKPITEQKAKLSQDKARAEQEIYQLQNKQKILLNRIRGEERRARNHRLIQHGLIMEGVFPAVKIRGLGAAAPIASEGRNRPRQGARHRNGV